MDAVLKHAFLTGRSVGRLPGEEAMFDVFLSYRVDSDSEHVKKLYDKLMDKGVKVWWDKECLKPGVSWEEGFCDGLVKSRCFVPLLSRKAIKSRFEALTENSWCDNVLLEYRLAVELADRGMLERMYPVFIGDEVVVGGGVGGENGDGNEDKATPKQEQQQQLEQENTTAAATSSSSSPSSSSAAAAAASAEVEEAGEIESEGKEVESAPHSVHVYSHYFKSKCQPDPLPLMAIRAVENKLAEHLEKAGLAFPLRDSMSVKQIFDSITAKQGGFIEGDEGLEVLMEKQAMLIQEMVVELQENDEKAKEEQDALAGGGFKKNVSQKRPSSSSKIAGHTMGGGGEGSVQLEYEVHQLRQQLEEANKRIRSLEKQLEEGGSAQLEHELRRQLEEANKRIRLLEKQLEELNETKTRKE